MEGFAKFQVVNYDEFSRAIQDVAASSLVSFEEEFRTQGRLLGAELMKRTPPFSGRAITRMLEARNAKLGFRDAEIESMTARKVGERRVEKDIRKVIYGLHGAQLSERHMQVSRGNNANATEWGVLQRCEGKQAVRVFATKSGTVYGADLSEWHPDATLQDMASHHKAQRTKRGRVTMAGQKTRDVGRWRWLNVFVTTEEMVARFVAFKQQMIGQAKGGWASLFLKCGGKLSSGGWVGRHAEDAGECQASFEPGKVSIVAINRSAWASAGDPDRVIEKSLEGRQRAMEGRIEHNLEQQWAHPGRLLA